MASIFSSAGPVGSNISDYTSLPNTRGIGPVASGAEYASMLGQAPSSFTALSKGLSGVTDASKAINPLSGPQTMLPMMQLQPPRQAGSLQAVDLLSLLRNLGGY